jgi:succinate dehydrogenase / fumarate reductase cytochrome b subunit
MPDASLKKKRPLWYNLSPLNLPLPGLVSILHRISGAVLFLLLLWLLYLLDQSLTSAERFEAVRQTMAHPLVKLVLLGLLWAFLHHLCAGIRYLFLDVDKGVDLATARATSVAVLAVSLVLTALAGWRLLL